MLTPGKPKSLYRCPLCSQPLTIQSSSYRCINNHCFDIAKEGYVNLLPVNKKRSKYPGDSKEMLLARRQFLHSGFYTELAEAISGTLSNSIAGDGGSILDLGCGEGYYTQYAGNALQNDTKHVAFYGVDIAKQAVQLASRQNKKANFSVASSVGLPFLDNAFDVIFCVFAPYNEAEIGRLLKPQGKFLLVGPGEAHLKEMAQYIYDNVSPHKGNPIHKREVDMLACVDEQILNINKHVPGAMLEPLLMMTPYYWSISEKNKSRLLSLPGLDITFNFSLKLYEKKITGAQN